MGDFVNLYDWIQTVSPDDFPPAPHKLSPGITILNWKKQIKYLRKETSNSARAMTGALQERLRTLHELWNSGRSK
jgi:hypothetical protein